MLYVTYRDGYALVTCCRCPDAVPSCVTCQFGPFTDEVADLAVEAVAGMLRQGVPGGDGLTAPEPTIPDRPGDGSPRAGTVLEPTGSTRPQKHRTRR